MNAKRIYIGWKRFPVYEDLNALKCFNCQQFHHKSDNCANGIVCPNCSKDYSVSDCQSEVACCINCTISNSRYQTKYPVGHRANDRNCPSYLYQLNIAKFKINHG